MVLLTGVYALLSAAFVNILNEMRMGRASKEAIETLTKLSRKVHYEDGVEPTCLYAKRNQVLNENMRRLRQLTGVNVTYTSQDFSGKHTEAPYKDRYPQEKDLRAFLDKVRSVFAIDRDHMAYFHVLYRIPLLNRQST